jgi:hypothetical protein
MIHIKRFIDKVSIMETKQGKDVVIPIGEARGLRDELSKLLVDNYELLQNKGSVEPVFQVEMNGGRF